MLCSISKSSGSGWLDRLRISKGFPISSDLGLDNFLSSNQNPNPPIPDAPPPPPPPPQTSDFAIEPSSAPIHPVSNPTTRDGSNQLFDLMSDALAELFVMGDPQPPPKSRTLDDSRRNPRKHPNPKIRVPSASASADHSAAEVRKKRSRPRRRPGAVDPAADLDLSSYSQTEVTVIDTSSPVWKTERLIFRKGNVWKVRDKKTWHVCRKKRKLNFVEKSAAEKKRGRPRKELLASLDEGCTDADKANASEGAGDQIKYLLNRPKFLRLPCVPTAKVDERNLAIKEATYKLGSLSHQMSGSQNPS